MVTELIERFRATVLSHSEWNHRAHLEVALRLDWVPPDKGMLLIDPGVWCRQTPPIFTFRTARE